MMSSCAVLIDFENVFYQQTITEGLLYSSFKGIVDVILEDSDIIDNISIRLYDGWRSNNFPTQKADDVATVLPIVEQRIFPILRNKEKIYGSIEMAESQIGIDYVWPDTLRKKKGIHRLKIREDAQSAKICKDTDKCILKIISNASKGQDARCPNEGCGFVDIKKLERNEQKMIDAMIGSDLIECVCFSDSSSVVVSDDSDLFPFLFLAGIHKKSESKITYLTKNQQNVSKYTEIFQSNNINVSVKKWQ